MSTEFGIFNDEGCIDRGFYSAGEARAARDELYADDLWSRVEEMCHDHDEQPATRCEECYGEDADA